MTRAPLYALGSALLFGASTPFAKLLLGDVGPWLLAGVLYLGSGVGLAIVFALQRTRGRRNYAALGARDLPWLAVAVASGGVVGPLLLMLGLALVPAATASLLLNLEGLATLAIAWIVLRENVDRRVFAGAMAIFAGAVLLSWRGELGGVSWGALAIAGACLAWGVDNNVTRKLALLDPIQLAMIKGLVAGAVNTALALATGAALPAAAIVAAAGAVGFLGYGVSLALFLVALRDLGAARTGAYFSTAPFVGAVLGTLVFGEPVTIPLLLAGALMAVGVYLHVVERHVHEHVHEDAEHEHLHAHDEHHQHAHGASDPPGEPHAHAHRHGRLLHTHTHYPDVHHRHRH
jgi:drug/metabolite transporter (DMT)-like permease